MDIPNLCAKAANADMNSDLDCSDVDFDSDSQNKPNAQDSDEKNVTQKRDETCEKLKKMFFTRVSTDSTETDCSIDYKGQTPHDQLTPDNKTLMECDSSKKADNFCIVQNLVSSTDDIDLTKEHVSLDAHKTVDLIAKCVPNNECLSVSVVDVVDTNITLETDLTENST